MLIAQNMKKIFKTFWYFITFTVLIIKRWIEYKIIPSSTITILLFHDVKKSQERKLASLIIFLQKFGTFVSIEDFQSIVQEKRKINSPLFLVTFDDGFVSSGEFASKYLDPMGIKAVFFVCPSFIGVQKSISDSFIVNNLFLGDYDQNLITETQSPMNHDQITELLKRGHSIGSHSFNHKKLSTLRTPDDLQKEILISKITLEENYNTTIYSFAYPFGDIGSISKEALDLIQANYSLNFTGIRGHYNPKYDHPCAIWRQSINLDDSFYFCLFSALGGLNLFYTTAQKKYKVLIG